jgi:hypothetical protein
MKIEENEEECELMVHFFICQVTSGSTSRQNSPLEAAFVEALYPKHLRIETFSADSHTQLTFVSSDAITNNHRDHVMFHALLL